MQNTRIRRSAALLALAAVVAVPLSAPAAEAAGGAAAPAQVSIPFVDHDNIRDWQADKQDGLWIQDQRRNWYYAKLLGPCIGLDWALTIGFVTGGAASQLDRFSSIVVPHEGRCQITSLTRSDPPPPSDKKRKKHKVTAEKPAT